MNEEKYRCIIIELVRNNHSVGSRKQGVFVSPHIRNVYICNSVKKSLINVLHQSALYIRNSEDAQAILWLSIMMSARNAEKAIMIHLPQMTRIR